MLRRILIAFILIFAIWHFEWICSLFFMSMIRPEYYVQLMAVSVILWLLVLLPGLAGIWLHLRGPLRHADMLNSGEADQISDPELRKSLDRILFLPIWSGIYYSIAWWVTGIAALVYWFQADVGDLAAGSLLVGQISGALACPFMMIGATGALSGSVTERFTVEALRRNFNFKAARLGLGARLILAFMLFAVGFTVWLGGFGFFASYHSVVFTSQSDLARRQASIVAVQQQLPDNAGTIADWQKLATTLYGATADPSKSVSGEYHQVVSASALNPEAMVSRSAGLSLDARLMREIQAELAEHPANEANAGFYDARTEYVVGWTPLRSPDAGDLFLVSIVRVELALTDLPVYLFWLGIFTLAGILVVLVLAISNASVVLQGIQSIYAMVRNLGDGNLAVRRGAPGLDESGMLTIDLNLFLANLSGIIQRIRETVNSVAGEIQSLEKTARELSGGAQSQAAAVEQASASMEEVSSSTREIAEMVSGQADRVGEVTRALNQDLGAAIERVAERANVVNESAEESLSRAREVREVNADSIAGMEQIQNSSNDILSIVDVIVSISDKTNLLALNASIEAARAGEAGRGFAVVADEVSRLAEQSNQAIAQIKKLIDINNSRVSDGAQKVGSLGSAIEQLTRSAQLAREVGEEIQATAQSQRTTGRDVMESVTEMDSTAKMIARATGEQKTTTGEMARTLEQINDVAQRTAESADRIAEVVRQLRGESDQLHEITQGFIVRA